MRTLRIAGLVAAAVVLTGCATPPGQLQDSDFNIRQVNLEIPAKDAAANFRDGIRYCGSQTGFVAVTHHGIPDCGAERSDGSMTCDLYLPQAFGMGRTEAVLGIVNFKPAPQGSTATLKVQTYVAKNQSILDAWEKFTRGKHLEVCR